MASLWDLVETGYEVVTGASTWADLGETWDKYYEGSFLDKALSSEWLDSSTSKGKLASAVAGKAYDSMFGKDKTPQFGAPRGARLSGSGSRAAVGSASYKTSAVDLGYTAKVQNAFRAAQNARAGSAVAQTIQRLQTKPAKGPLLQLGTTPINVAPRSRG